MVTQLQMPLFKFVEDGKPESVVDLDILPEAYPSFILLLKINFQQRRCNLLNGKGAGLPFFDDLMPYPEDNQLTFYASNTLRDHFTYQSLGETSEEDIWKQLDDAAIRVWERQKEACIQAEADEERIRAKEREAEVQLENDRKMLRMLAAHRAVQTAKVTKPFFIDASDHIYVSSCQKMRTRNVISMPITSSPSILIWSRPIASGGI